MIKDVIQIITSKFNVKQVSSTHSFFEGGDIDFFMLPADHSSLDDYLKRQGFVTVKRLGSYSQKT